MARRPVKVEMHPNATATPEPDPLQNVELSEIAKKRGHEPREQAYESPDGFRYTKRRLAEKISNLEAKAAAAPAPERAAFYAAEAAKRKALWASTPWG